MPAIQHVPTPHSYSTAVAAGEFVYLGLHRGFGNTFAEQLDGTFEAIRRTLAEFNLALDSLVKVNVWLREIGDLPDMEKRFRTYFAEDAYPARMTSTTEFIDDDCMLMIDGVAYRGQP
jgi:2-iminobutanoate/2-iminopropanoate deaminase